MDTVSIESFCSVYKYQQFCFQTQARESALVPMAVLLIAVPVCYSANDLQRNLTVFIMIF